MPSGLRYRAKFSGKRCADDAGGAGVFSFFLGEDIKKLRMPLDGAGAGAGIGAGECDRALYCAIICGSRLTFSVRVNSSLLCSILNKKFEANQCKFLTRERGLTVRIPAQSYNLVLIDILGSSQNEYRCSECTSPTLHFAALGRSGSSVLELSNEP